MQSQEMEVSGSPQPIQKRKAKSKSSMGQYKKQPLSEADRNLYEIFTFYASVYNHLNVQKNATFQDKQNSVKILNLQSFLLFTKQFGIRKILKLDQVKLLFKKYSRFGRYLELQDFRELLEKMSSLDEAKKYLEERRSGDTLYLDVANQKDNFYRFLDLHHPAKYREKMKTISLPFQMRYEKYDQTPNLINSRRFSLPSLGKRHSVIIPVRLLKKRNPEVQRSPQAKVPSIPQKKSKKLLSSSGQDRKHSTKKLPQNVPLQEPALAQIKSKIGGKDSILTKITNIDNQISSKLKQMIMEDEDDEMIMQQYGKPSKQKSLQNRIDDLLREQEEEELKIMKKLSLQKHPKKS